MNYDKEYKELEDKYSKLLDEQNNLLNEYNSFIKLNKEVLNQLEIKENKYNALQKEFEQYKRESIKWSVEDFTEYNTDGQYIITEERAQEALEEMIRKHDALWGISWDTVRCYLEEYGTLNPNYNEAID